VWLLSLLLSVFFHHYKTVVPRGSYAVGEVIQANDLNRGDFWSSDVMDLATDPRQVIGHTVLKPLRPGSYIRLSDVSK
jgi:flagella basal body P-ring formation protein FlgA